MPLHFPSLDTLHDAFHPAMPLGRRPSPIPQASSKPPTRASLPARSELYTAWSVIDDAKKKANALSAEATKEFDKASAAAQAKTGGIELYSANYYAACTFGGLLACVSAVWSLESLSARINSGLDSVGPYFCNVGLHQGAPADDSRVLPIPLSLPSIL